MNYAYLLKSFKLAFHFSVYHWWYSNQVEMLTWFQLKTQSRFKNKLFKSILMESCTFNCPILVNFYSQLKDIQNLYSLYPKMQIAICQGLMIQKQVFPVQSSWKFEVREKIVKFLSKTISRINCTRWIWQTVLEMESVVDLS